MQNSKYYFAHAACELRGHEKSCYHGVLCRSPTAESVKFIFGGCGGRALREPPKITPRCGAGARVARLCESQSLYYLICYLLYGQKVTPKTAAVKRFRGRPCACAESDACGTFEAIKRFPILNAPSPRPPFFRNRFCRGLGWRV